MFKNLTRWLRKQTILSRQSRYLTQIPFAHLVPRIGDARLNLTIVGEHDKSFRVEVQPARRVDVPNANVLAQSRAPGRIRELAEHLKRLMQQN